MNEVVHSLFTPETFQKPERKVLSISQLVFEVKQNIESSYRQVTVVGEVSSFKPWRSGHWYFDLKDEQALIPAVMFKTQCGRVKFEVKDGMQIMATGRVSMYVPQSKIQLMVDEIEPMGQGALALAFEQLKKKLEQEGLFAKEHKKALPSFPRRVGLVTSPQGAVIRDMIRILKHRMPGVDVLLAPVRVQGPGAALEIAQAIQRLDGSGCDVVIVGRGGGSLEDLWAFNEEPVARALFACQTPVVSAVGHETDFTIADFVADLRCATPTHAAQTVVPDVQDIRLSLGQTENRLRRQIKTLVTKQHLRLERLAKKLKEPKVLLMQALQRLDELSQRGQQILLQRIEKHKTRVQKLELRINQAILVNHREAKKKIGLYAAKLHALSPLKVLARGYTLVSKDKEVVSSVQNLHVGESLSVRMSDGTLHVHIDDIEKGGPRG